MNLCILYINVLAMLMEYNIINCDITIYRFTHHGFYDNFKWLQIRIGIYFNKPSLPKITQIAFHSIQQCHCAIRLPIEPNKIIKSTSYLNAFILSNQITSKHWISWIKTILTSYKQTYFQLQYHAYSTIYWFHKSHLPLQQW